MELNTPASLLIPKLKHNNHKCKKKLKFSGKKKKELSNALIIQSYTYCGGKYSVIKNIQDVTSCYKYVPIINK